MGRIRKGSDLPKKKVEDHQLYILLSFDSVRALEIHDVARATSHIACALEMRSSYVKFEQLNVNKWPK